MFANNKIILIALFGLAVVDINVFNILPTSSGY